MDEGLSVVCKGFDGRRGRGRQGPGPVLINHDSQGLLPMALEPEKQIKPVDL